MGAQRHLPELHDHDTTRDARPPPPINDDELTMPIDQDELRMLNIFHKSFNLPGLRFGLVRPVLDDDYYPPDEDFDTEPEPAQPEQPPSMSAVGSQSRSAASSSQPRRPRPVYEEPDSSQQLAALLQKTKAMQLAADKVLAGEGDAPKIDDEDEPIGIEDPQDYAAPVHQRKVLSRPGSSSARPSSSGSSKPLSASGRAQPRQRW